MRGEYDSVVTPALRAVSLVLAAAVSVVAYRIATDECSVACGSETSQDITAAVGYAATFSSLLAAAIAIAARRDRTVLLGLVLTLGAGVACFAVLMYAVSRTSWERRIARGPRRSGAGVSGCSPMCCCRSR